MNSQTKMTRRTVGTGFAVAITGVAMSRFAGAQTPEASPDVASPEASPIAFPDGPLGVQLQWLQDSLNSETGVGVEEIPDHFAPSFLETTSAVEISAQISDYATTGGPYAIDTSTMIMTMDFPPSNASFDILNESGETLRGGISIDRDSGLIGGFSLELPSAATLVG